MRALKVLVANPSADVYGSDLQLLDSITGMVEQGMQVLVAMPQRGRLSEMIESRGASIALVDAPVVRRAMLSPRNLVGLTLGSPAAIARLVRFIKAQRPDVLYVNTMTLPWWLAAAKLAGIPSLCHVHEAENQDKKVVLTALTAPLMLCDVVITNSKAATAALTSTVGWLAGRIRLVYNGVPGPPAGSLSPPPADETFHVVAVCRLSPRKAPSVALEAVALLRRDGRDVRLAICGTPFAGYEWYEAQLRERSAQDDLAGAVSFLGYVSPVWPVLERSHALVAPSLREPFGNAVVEAQLALRPVIASAALGHLETVQDGVTGLLVPPGDVAALSAAIARLMDDRDLADRLAQTGHAHAKAHFNVARYADEITALVSRTVARNPFDDPHQRVSIARPANRQR